MILFITNICSHYRKKAFELLGRTQETLFLFFSEGKESYWLKEHGTSSGDFNFRQLQGFRLGQTRITPALLRYLLLEDYEVVIKCVNGKFALLVSFLIARLRHKPFILWTGIWMRIQTPPHRVIFPVVRYIYTHSDAVVVYGDHVRDYLLSEGVCAEKIFVACQAVDNDHYRQKIEPEAVSKSLQQWSIPEESFRIMFLGRLEAEKGLDYLLEAFQLMQNPQAYLILAGKGSRDGMLNQQIAARGLSEQIRFTGYIPVEETPHWYALADVLVLPSITTSVFKEPWGLVINEAMNQGLPVVTTEAVGAAVGGLVIDAETGFILPEKDAESMSYTLNKLAASKSLRYRLGRRAKEHVLQWNYRRMVRGFLNALDYVQK